MQYKMPLPYRIHSACKKNSSRSSKRVLGETRMELEQEVETDSTNEICQMCHKNPGTREVLCDNHKAIHYFCVDCFQLKLHEFQDLRNMKDDDIPSSTFFGRKRRNPRVTIVKKRCEVSS